MDEITGPDAAAFDLQLFTSPPPGDPPPGTPPPGSAPPSGVDPALMAAELDRYRQDNDRMRQALEGLRPYAEDIEWIAGDPAHAEFVRTSRQSYDEMRKRQSAVSPELEPLKVQLDELTGFVKEFRQAQAQAASAPRQKQLAEGKTFCEELIRKHPNELGRNVDPSMAWAGALDNICTSRGLTWEEGWKILAPAFVKTQTGAPPPSSRMDAGMPGLPPPSRPPPAEQGNPAGKKLSAYILERMGTPT